METRYFTGFMVHSPKPAKRYLARAKSLFCGGRLGIVDGGRALTG